MLAIHVDFALAEGRKQLIGRLTVIPPEAAWSVPPVKLKMVAPSVLPTMANFLMVPTGATRPRGYRSRAWRCLPVLHLLES